MTSNLSSDKYCSGAGRLGIRVFTLGFTSTGGIEMRSIVAVALLFLAACGGSALDAGFSGSWTGPTTVQMAASGSIAYDSKLVIAASGKSATVSDVCPGGEGTLTAEGSGKTLSWKGSHRCSPVSLGNCAAMTLLLETANATLNSSSSLTVTATGRISGCGLDQAATISFLGAK